MAVGVHQRATGVSRVDRGVNVHAALLGVHVTTVVLSLLGYLLRAIGAGRRNALVLAAERIGPTVVTVSVLRTELVDEFCLENEQSWKHMQAPEPVK